MNAPSWMAAAAALAIPAFGPAPVDAQRRAEAPGVTRTVRTAPSGERVRTTRRVSTRPNGTRVVERRQVRTGERGRTVVESTRRVRPNGTMHSIVQTTHPDGRVRVRTERRLRDGRTVVREEHGRAGSPARLHPRHAP
ncbi:MAG: hypothetical protein AAF447_08745, partial [Myxococcota bacterium]